MFLRTATSALAVLALTVPAFADVTPAEVWQNWLDYYEANGYSVSEGGREEAGDVLTLRDVVIAHAAAEDQPGVQFTTAEIVLTATGDGRVRSTIAETTPMVLTIPDDDGKITVTGVFTVRDTEVVSSGSVQDMIHETSAGEVEFALQTVATPEGTHEVPVTVTASNLTSRQQLVQGDDLQFDVSVAAERVALVADITDAGEDSDDGPTSVKLDGTLEQLSGSSAGRIPGGMDASKDMAAAMRAGMDVGGTFTVASGRLAFDITETNDEGNPETVTGQSSLEGVEFTVAMGSDGLKYQGAVDSTATEMTVPDLPAPVSYSMNELTFDVQMPVTASDEPAPMKLAYSIGGLTLADSVWDLFDPEQVLPRDPASLDVDITGLVRLAADLFNPEAIEAVTEDGGMPFEPVEIALNKLALSAVGASFDSSGELRVPEGGDMTQPVGTLNARLEGLDGLIDRLVQLGVIGNDEVIGYRMMLAMFARPAPEGGDALVSEFEFRENGEIFANGQQVQ